MLRRAVSVENRAACAGVARVAGVRGVKANEDASLGGGILVLMWLTVLTPANHWAFGSTACPVDGHHNPVSAAAQQPHPKYFDSPLSVEAEVRARRVATRDVQRVPARLWRTPLGEAGHAVLGAVGRRTQRQVLDWRLFRQVLGRLLRLDSTLNQPG